jgi:Tol biopolymer transport system component
VRRVADEGSRPSWSPDGREIVYETENFSNYWGRNHISQLWIVSVDGEERRLLAEGDAVQPSWSPHQHRIAFWKIWGEQAGQRDIWTIRSDGTDDRPVTHDPSVDWCPVWSHDGRHLYFASDRGGRMNLWRVPIDEETGHTLGEPEPVTVPAQSVRTFSFSRDGEAFVYATVTLTDHLLVADFDPIGRAALGGPRQVTGGSLRVLDPCVSPDGLWVAFRRQAEQEDLCLVRADGSALRKLTDDVYRDRGPSWTPDGSRIIFYSDRSGRYEIWSVRPDGSELRQLSRTTGTTLWYPRMSTGARLLAAYNDEGSTLFNVDPVSLELSLPKTLPPVSDGIFFFARAWSPNGRYLAGWAGPSSSSEEGDLVLFSPNDGAYTTIEANIHEDSLAWLADGSGLFYQTKGAIRVHDLESGNSMPVLEHEVLSGTYSFTVSRDARRIFLSVSSTESDLWLARFESR